MMMMCGAARSPLRARPRLRVGRRPAAAAVAVGTVPAAFLRRLGLVAAAAPVALAQHPEVVQGVPAASAPGDDVVALQAVVAVVAALAAAVRLPPDDRLVPL